MKKHLTTTNIIFFLWGVILLLISEFFTAYTRYYLNLLIAVLFPIMIYNLIKQKKEDKLKNTQKLKSSVYRMLIVALILVIFFYWQP